MYEAPRCDTPPPGGFVPLARIRPLSVRSTTCGGRIRILFPFSRGRRVRAPESFRGSVTASDPATGSPITNFSANSLPRGVPPVRAKPQGFGPPPSKFHNIDAMTAKPGQVLRAPFGILSTFPHPTPHQRHHPHPTPNGPLPPVCHTHTVDARAHPHEIDSQTWSHSVTELSYFVPSTQRPKVGPHAPFVAPALGIRPSTAAR
jgi:hypothetical protein